MNTQTRPACLETIRFAYGDVALGTIVVAESGRGVVALFIGDDRAKLLRDLKSDGSIAGYRWDVQRKRRLINMEGVA
jgi:hypothetical protein